MDKRCYVIGVRSQCVAVCSRNLGNESRGFSKAAHHREENALNDLRSDVEGYG